MKKILFIWNNKLYDKALKEENIKGGVETYLSYLKNFFLLKGYQIDFIYLHDDKEPFLSKCDSLENGINFIKIKSKKKFKKIRNFSKKRFINLLIHFLNFYNYHKNINYEYKALNLYLKNFFKSYNYIINSVPCIFSKKIRNYKFMFFIQQTDASLYEKCFYFNKLEFKNFSIIYKFIFLLVYKSLFFDKNILKKTKNVVFFSKDMKYLKLNKKALIGSIPIELDFFQKKSNWYIKNKNNNSILYFGRFDNNSKNLELLSKISKKGNINVDLYGHGEYETELRKNFLLNLKGRIKTVSEKIDILSKYDLFLLTSNYEGLPIAAIELLSMGVIGIIRNTFLEAKNLIPKKYHDLLLIGFNANINQYIYAINYLKNMSKVLKNEIRINLINHIKNNYHTKIFENNWNDILEINNKDQF